MENIIKKLACLFAALTLLFTGVNSMWAATATTVYYAVPSATVGTYTVKCNTNHKGDGEDWHLYDMRLTDSTYNGNLLYVCTFTDTYDGLGKLQFQLHDMTLSPGETWKSQQEPIGSWTADVASYNGKIYIHDVAGWKDFGRDITIYAVPEIMNGSTWDEASHTLYANFKYGDGESEWVNEQMSKTAYTYKGEPIYSVTMFIRYNVIKRVEFLYNDGSDHELYVYVPSPQHVTGDIDDKTFVGTVAESPTWIPSYVRDYTISYDMNGGEWGSGWVGSRTYGEGDVDISSDVVKTDYNFDGWYDNGSFTGEPVTSVSSTLADNITLYAKWTDFSKYTLTPALNPIICTASEGDVVVVTVSATQSAGAYIQLEDKDGVAFRSPVPVSAAGTYAIPLTASDAAKVNAGLIVSGSNYTISDVTIKYQKTLWSGTVSDNTSWTQSDVLATELFSGLTADDFLGFNISAINDGANWHEYDIRTNWRTNIITGTPGTVGTEIHNLTAAIVDSLQKQTNVIVARYLDVSALYTYIDTKNYTVEEHNNGGRIWADSVGSYTFGVGATLPTEVTKWNYNFEGWYNNAELDGDPVTSIGTGEYGHKDYYAKWTSIVQEYPIASYPEFLAAQEGDIIVVNVTSTQASSTIYLYPLGSATDFEHRDISSTGKHIFQLSAAAAASLRTYGLLVTGHNFTFDDVQIRYRKTIWTGTLSDNDGWKEVEVDKSIFSGLSGGDFIGFNITEINDGESYHTYALRADYEETPQISGSTTEAGVGIHELSPDNVTAIQNAKKRVDVDAQYLDISNLYAYLTTGRFLVIYHDGDKEDDSHAPVDAVESFDGGTVGKIIEYRMNVRELDHWYSLYLPFTVSAVKVWDEEDNAYYDLVPFYRTGGKFYTGHYIIRTPVLINNDSIATANFSNWNDPESPTGYLPAKNTPYIIQWHDTYFEGKYISFFGAAGQSIPTEMTEKAAPKTKNYVSVRGNDAMVDGTVVDAYTLNGDETWERPVDKGESVTIHPFECYIRANSEVTKKFLVIRRGMNFDDTPTGFESIDVSKPVNAKVLIDGQLYIIRDGKMYNLQGVLVREGKEEQQ